MPDVDIPNEVASKSFVNQTGNIAATTIFTPSAAGLFRFSFYIEGSPVVSTVNLTLAWTDDFGAQSLSVGFGGNFIGDTLPIRIASGSLSLSASQSGGTTYSVYIAVEQL